MADITTAEPYFVRSTAIGAPTGYARTPRSGIRSTSSLQGLTIYLRAVRDVPVVKRILFGANHGSVWIVTEVEAGGDLDALDPILEAEAAARAASDVAMVFRVLDLSIGEELDEAPLNLTPIRS